MSLFRSASARPAWAFAPLLFALAPAAHADIGADADMPEAGAISTSDAGAAIILASLPGDGAATTPEPTPTITTGSVNDGLTIG